MAMMAVRPWVHAGRARHGLTGRQRQHEGRGDQSLGERVHRQILLVGERSGRENRRVAEMNSQEDLVKILIGFRNGTITLRNILGKLRTD
jgi:hypothetical protein